MHVGGKIEMRNKSKLETTEYGDLSPGSSARPTRNFPDLVTLS